MSQIEYNDLNKFFVSIGILLIGLTFLLPWLFLKEEFDLLIKTTDLNSLTEIAQNIIDKRQLFTSALTVLIPIISILSFLAGIYLIIIGIRGWKKIQKNSEEREQLINKKLTIEIENLMTVKNGETQPPKTSKTKKDYLSIPINNLWRLNHWGSNCAYIENGKMIFKGERTRLETDGSHIDLPNILMVGKIYEISCYVKAQESTTSKFQLWCHDNIGIEPYGCNVAVPYATPSVQGEKCKLRFEAAINSNLRIHLQYMPGLGQIEVSDVRIKELKITEQN